jgi:hypothetical protein
LSREPIDEPASRRKHFQEREFPHHRSAAGDVVLTSDPAEVQSAPRLRDVGRSVTERVAREHPTLVLTLLYLGLTYIGMMHDVFFYLAFKVRILEFAETSDFLMAAIRNPLTIFLCLLPFPLLMLLAHWRRSMITRVKWYGDFARRYEGTVWSGVPVRVLSATLFILVYVTLFTELYAFSEAARVRQGKGQRVGFARNDGIVPDERPILLGTTGKFVILYFPTRKATEVVPIDNTAAITVDSRRRKERLADSLAALQRVSPKP